jgi:beta-galactosidase/beta-glucuronidase
MNLIFKGCTAEIVSLKGECHTTGEASGVITSGGAFHLITLSGGKPGVLVTPNTTTLLCLGFSRTEVTGSIIGTITKPACGVSSSELTLSFEAEGAKQKHLEYTEKPFDLSASTEDSAGKTTSTTTAGLTSEVTLTSAVAGTLECT